MKKISIIKYLLMIVFIMFFINIKVSASEKPSSFTPSQTKEQVKWTGRSSEANADCTLNSLCPWPKDTTVDGTRTYVYSLQQLKRSPIGITMNNPTEIMSTLNNRVPDYGLIYLMNQTSYLSDTSSREGYNKVQAAIWLYVYYHRGEVVNDPTVTSTGTNVGYVFGTGSSPNTDNIFYNVANARTAIDLYNHAVAEDEAHRNDQGDGFTLSTPSSDVFDMNSSILTSKEVTVNTTGSNACRVSVNNARVVDNNGNSINETVNAYVIDSNNIRVTSATNGTKLRVRIEGYNEGSQVKTVYVTLKVDCDSTINHIYRYRPQTDTTISDVILGKNFTGTLTKTQEFHYKSEKVYYPVRISKVDITNNKRIAGARLKITNKETGEVLEEWTSTESEHITNRLVSGVTYVLSETKAANKYILTTSTVEFTLSRDGTASPMEYTYDENGNKSANQSVVIKNKPYPVIKFRKTDSVTNNEVTGATLVIKDSDNNIVDEWVTTSTPREVSLGPGSYTLEETVPARNYIQTTEKISFSVDNQGNPSTTLVNLKNKPYPTVRISKQDISTGREITGARLKLYNPITRYTYEWVSTSLPYEIQIAPGTYILSEVVAPDGYIKTTDTLTFNVDENGNTTPRNIIMYNEQKRTLVLAKTDSETGEYVAGAHLRVRSSDGLFDEVVITQARSVKLEGLDFGDYIITEEEAPPHYDRNKEEKTITISNSSPKETKVEIPNNPLKKLEISKLDSETQSYVSGATIVIRNAITHEEVKRFVTENDAYMVELPYGLYEIEEVEAPEHYRKDSNLKGAFLSNLSPSITKVTLSNVPLRKIGLAKVDMETGVKVAGATLTLTNKDTNETYDVVTTDTGYSIIPDLYYGTYRVTEKEAPAHYKLNAGYYDLTISKDSPVEYDFEFPDAPLRKISLALKDSETGQYIEGVTLVLKNGSGEEISRIVTQNDRTVIEDLYYGIYYIEEENVPSGYEGLKEPYVFIVNKQSSMIIDIDITNKPLRELYLSKTNAENGNYVAGAHLVVRDKDLYQIGNEIITEEEPVKFPILLDYGTYFIEEVEAPENFKRKESMEQVVITDESPLKVKVKMQNVPYREFVIEKIDSESKLPIAGAKFAVRDETGNIINEFTTTQEPTVIKNIYYGSYSIEEVEAPVHYHKNDDVKNIVVNNNSDLSIKFTFTNAPLRSIKVRKLDSETLEEVNGAVFRLTDKNGNTIGELDTANGSSQIDDLYYGTYYLEEIIAPNGYSRNSEKFKIDVTTESPLVIEMDVKDDPLRSLSIAKINSENNRLIKDAVIVVKDGAGNIIEKYTTKDERHVIENLTYGVYTIEEESCPIGYKKNTDVVTVEITKDSEYTVYADIANEPLYSIKIVKLGSDNMKSLTGAKFRVTSTDPSNPYEQEFISEADGIYIDNIPKGTYQIEEIEAPKGYNIIDLVQEFEVTMDGDEITFNVIDDVPKTSSTVFYLIMVSILLVVGYILINKSKKISKVSS